MNTKNKKIHNSSYRDEAVTEMCGIISVVKDARRKKVVNVPIAQGAMLDQVKSGTSSRANQVKSGAILQFI